MKSFFLILLLIAAKVMLIWFFIVLMKSEGEAYGQPPIMDRELKSDYLGEQINPEKLVDLERASQEE